MIRIFESSQPLRQLRKKKAAEGWTVDVFFQYNYGYWYHFFKWILGGSLLLNCFHCLALQAPFLSKLELGPSRVYFFFKEKNLEFNVEHFVFVSVASVIKMTRFCVNDKLDLSTVQGNFTIQMKSFTNTIVHCSIFFFFFTNKSGKFTVLRGHQDDVISLSVRNTLALVVSSFQSMLSFNRAELWPKSQPYCNYASEKTTELTKITPHAQLFK